uniref:Uncharacterized protein n=1 Tax=Acrobeloides nanus TaxID=290746 RepID=A0A914EBF2_9BILA
MDSDLNNVLSLAIIYAPAWKSDVGKKVICIYRNEQTPKPTICLLYDEIPIFLENLAEVLMKYEKMHEPKEGLKFLCDVKTFLFGNVRYFLHIAEVTVSKNLIVIIGNMNLVTYEKNHIWINVSSALAMRKIFEQISLVISANEGFLLKEHDIRRAAPQSVIYSNKFNEDEEEIKYNVELKVSELSDSALGEMYLTISKYYSIKEQPKKSTFIIRSKAFPIFRRLYEETLLEGNKLGLFEIDIDEKPKNDIANPIETSTSRKFHRVFKERESQQEFNSPEEKFEFERCQELDRMNGEITALRFRWTSTLEELERKEQIIREKYDTRIELIKKKYIG